MYKEQHFILSQNLQSMKNILVIRQEDLEVISALEFISAGYDRINLKAWTVCQYPADSPTFNKSLGPDEGPILLPNLKKS